MHEIYSDIIGVYENGELTLTVTFKTENAVVKAVYFENCDSVSYSVLQL